MFSNSKSIKAHLHNLRTNQKPPFLDGICQKVRSVAEIVGTTKGLYDVGKGLYKFGRIAAPVIAALVWNKYVN